MSEDEREAARAKSPFGREAQQLADEAWQRARAHELSEDERQQTVDRLRELAEREPELKEQLGIEAEMDLVEQVFDLVEQEEREAPIHDSEILQEAYAVYGAASHYEPGPDETSEERQAHVQRLNEALDKLSHLADRGNEREEAVVDDLITALSRVLSATEYVEGRHPDDTEGPGGA